MTKLYIILIVLFCVPLANAGDLTKQAVKAYSVSEDGKIRVKEAIKILDGDDVVSRKVLSVAHIDPKIDSVDGKDAKTIAIMNKVKAVNIPVLAITGSGLERAVTYDNSITPSGHVQVRRITRIYDNGVLVNKQYHRHVISPGDDCCIED